MASKKFGVAKGYNNNEVHLSCHFIPSGSDGGSVGFTGSDGFASVTKVTPGIFKVTLDDTFPVLHGIQATVCTLSGVQSDAKIFLSSSTGNIVHVTGSKNFLVALSGAGGLTDLPGVPGNKIFVSVVLRNTSGK
jgi:hypothetical protein